ncbi:hypothetical protein GDO81_005501 [Engystomops pustulosus]|uniref:Uncharacterized protein n=1 Tax=Engystomops pustulosus TaxID=76066 RepID=A0AAV7CPZ0_ENGPU|nr:hypothetical protein GDO81_005501 [Engystomops pustulosus]
MTAFTIFSCLEKECESNEKNPTQLNDTETIHVASSYVLCYPSGYTSVPSHDPNCKIKAWHNPPLHTASRGPFSFFVRISPLVCWG